MYALSDSEELALSKLSERYKHANAHPHVLAAIDSWVPNVHNSTAVKAESGKREVFILRYHPSVCAAAAAALRSTPLPQDTQVKLMFSWRNALPSHQGVINKHNHSKLLGNHNIS